MHRKASWVAVNQVIEKIRASAASRGRDLEENIRVRIRAGSGFESAGEIRRPSGSEINGSIPRQSERHGIQPRRLVCGDGRWIAGFARPRPELELAFPLSPVQPAAATTAASASPVRAVRIGNRQFVRLGADARQLEVSGDGGKTWIARALPLSLAVRLHLQPSDETTVVLASDHGVFISRDAGESWRQANLSELLIDDLTPVRSAIVVSTANGALFLSRDGGKSWGHMDGPNAEGSLSALRSRDAGNQLVAASATEGLFVLDMGSASSASADSIADSPAPQTVEREVWGTAVQAVFAGFVVI